VNAPDTPVAVVTGANRGIGRAITVALAAAGYAVAAGARDPASLADTVKEAGEAVVPVACDVREEGSVATLAERAEQLEGAVRAEITSLSPLRRLVQAEEVAAACVYLASGGSTAITGEDLNVTAGVVMY
jgi:NAD(P)-dependent dehydrogenase (short-subunit alcohol dehydrogenase family)